MAASAVWVAGSLVAAGILLVLLFRNHIERRFDRHLLDHMEEIVAASEIAPAGGLVLTWTPSDPRFNRPHSGWYWQIADGSEVIAQSDSVWRGRLPVTPPRLGSRPQIQLFDGPGRKPLRAIVQEITLPEASRPFTYVVAGPVSDIGRDVDLFVGQLWATLGVLGFGLLAAILFQVRFGLRPLRAIRRALADIRGGRLDRLPETFPAEVQPVVSELNALLDHDAGILERARMEAGNLAHALKNPLTVIRNEAKEVTGERGRVLREQVAAVTDRIDRYLSLARTAGTAGILGARTAVAGILDDLRFTMERLHRDRGITIELTGAEGLYFGGDAHDLAEMVGNLLDNACKWARSRVAVGASAGDGRLRIVIEDDGPGIPEGRRAEVLHRGRRLDEGMPGSGLGLAIARDIAELYRGSLVLADSPLGGLRVELELPAA